MINSCENIDQVVTLNFRRRSGLGLKLGGVVRKLYNLARGENPISYGAGQALVALPPSKVGIFTGAVVPEWLPNGENDGPLGALVLGHALKGMGHEVVFFTEREVFPMMERGMASYGEEFELCELEKGREDRHVGTGKDLDVAITVEKAGGNSVGVMHSVNGNSRDGTRANIDALIERMNDEGKITIGFGEYGNEIGFGKIYDEAREISPYGKKCRCPCGEGIITKVATTYLFPAGVSNWGAYGLAAALALLTGDVSLAHTPEKEKELLQIATEVDCRDGGTGKARFSVDGVPGETSMALVRLLGTLVSMGVDTSEYVRPF
jgi:hypothetical protein